jgi:hypothetical protein
MQGHYFYSGWPIADLTLEMRNGSATGIRDQRRLQLGAPNGPS